MKNRIPELIRRKWKILVYTLCGLGLAWIDLWRGIGNGAQWALAVNCTGFCIFPLIALRFDWRFLLPGSRNDKPYAGCFRYVFYSWIVMFTVLVYPVFRMLAPGTDYDPQILTAILNAGIYGAVVIRLIYAFLSEKNTPGKPHKVTGVFFIWLWFMVLAIVSVNRQVWPLWFLAIFGSLYLAPLKRDDVAEIVEGLVNGLIIGFFFIQGRAFLYRPYDIDARYRGHYTNPNVNAMFYLFIYIAWLVRMSLYRTKKAYKRYAFSFVFASAMWVFVFFTGSRGAYLAFLGTTFFYWFAENGKKGMKGLLSAAAKWGLMIAAMAIMFFPVYWCMRYIPPLRHHPVWYQDDYRGEDVNIMSWDPIDSDKYYELDEILPVLLGRLSDKVNAINDNGSVSDMYVLEQLALNMQGPVERYASADNTLHADPGTDKGPQYSADGERVYYYDDGIEPGTDADHPIFRSYQYESTFLRRVLDIRYYIYRYDISQIRLFGNEQSSIGVWVISDFFLMHAHNTVLQMMYWFGPVSGVLFAVGMICVMVLAIRTISLCRKSGCEERVAPSIFSLIIMVGYCLIGLTECIAFPGELGLVLYFIAYLPFMHNDADLSSVDAGLADLKSCNE